jgi:hypothetical protein
MAGGWHKPTGGPGDGFWPQNIEFECTNRAGAAATIGQHYALDLANAQAEVDNNTPGSSDGDGNNSGLNCFVDPIITADNLWQIYVVTLEAIADNATGRVCMRGRVVCNVASAVVAGDALNPATDNQLVVTITSSELPILALALEADVSNLALCLFDGLNKFGVDIL